MYIYMYTNTYNLVRSPPPPPPLSGCVCLCVSLSRRCNRRGASQRECRTAMEHNEIQWSGAPSCQRGSFVFYKSVSSRSGPDGPVQVWNLGEFYFVRCGPEDPVCIAEVTLLWEEQTQCHLLASARLYFLPEDTPKGRAREHGEDEVVAVSRRMVLRVDDLVRWSCASWSSGVKQPPCGANGLIKPPQSSSDSNNNNNNNLQDKKSKPLKDKNHQSVRVLSYPQYCRFRSLQRRIQDGATGPRLQDPHLLALGAVKVPPHTRLMYCRDTFNHPTLESSAAFSWQFRCPSLSLRGRPRKRRGCDGKDSPMSGSQSEAWIDRMKENVMGSVEFGCESSWLPHPEEQLFLDQLFSFMDRSGSPILKVPNLGFKKIDLFLMFSVVKRLGGHKKVTADRLWKVVYNELGGCPGSTSAATCTRRHYERLILPYEEHLRTGGTEFKVPETLSPLKPRGIRGRKPLQRGRKPGPKPKEMKMMSTKTPAAPLPHAIINPNGPIMVKRGRGRPPGTRNKATLIAQQQQARAKVLETPSLLLPPKGRGGSSVSSTHRVTLPMTPDLSPMSAPFLPFSPKPKELKSVASVAPPPGVILSTLPRHFVGGSLGGFSPVKGVCPLDVFRKRISLQRVPESPAQHSPTVFPLPDPPHLSAEQLQAPPPGHLNRCSGCNVEGDTQRHGSGRDARTRPPLPPLRVLPLNLDCSVQVCQLMRTRCLDSSQLQTFTRRLSEALSQDLSAKPPCSPITPPPEQALPLNLSKRFILKRASAEEAEPSLAARNGNVEQQSSPKRARVELDDDINQRGRSSSTGAGSDVNDQEEPADLSSPSRIRAFLLGLPPFQVKLDEDLNGARFRKLLPTGTEADAQQTEAEKLEGGVAVKKDVTAAEETVVVVETGRSNKVQQEVEEMGPAHQAAPSPAALK
ncbi:AT-rich interactive domain-containing protein 5B-like [Solea senegalensis]|uniref:AT-rich interactive domain-containing protein 5B-like n=3 Tax=Solea senegalensis TaxID=28829 RepID=A0AAV6SD94_SOLSE|nr:AT-rich interactive domain-containing protein 5B-like [Solea senegalensis]